MLEAILIPVAVLTAIGLLAGIMLALAAVFMRVPTDKKLEEVRAILPGVNCGVCGFAGCDEYAKAIVKGEAINRCVPGGDLGARKLSEVMGIPFEDVEEKVAFVACKGNYNATSDKMDYKGLPSCRAATLYYGGNSSCAYGCLAYGDCAAVCPYNAIDVVNGVAIVRAEKCAGCGMCVKACPKNLIALYPLNKPVHVACKNHDKGARTRKVCTNGCIGCGKCAKVCPTDAIRVEDDTAFIYVDKCIACGKCREVCPVHVIETYYSSCEALDPAKTPNGEKPDSKAERVDQQDK